jgi:hypothetical protein
LIGAIVPGVVWPGVVAAGVFPGPTAVGTPGVADPGITPGPGGVWSSAGIPGDPGVGYVLPLIGSGVVGIPGTLVPVAPVGWGV